MKNILTITAMLLFTSALGFSEKETPIKVACVGDSITFGFGIKNRGKQSYPAQLAELLGEGWTVGNFGRNGRTVLKQGHAPYWETPEYQAALKMEPDIVIIKLGTNDIREMNWEKHHGEYVSDYVALIRSFQELPNQPKIWICYPVPIYPGHEKFQFGNELLKTELIPKVDEVAAQTGAKIIDLNTALSGKKKMFPDNVHPNAEGAREIAREVSKALTN